VWLIDPEQRTVTIRRPDASTELLEIGATLTGGDVVKGFACQVSELFDQ
jgi:Uma2 family endonuclease